MPHTP